jgi:hypothetical protein
MSLIKFRYLIALSILIFIISSVFTGVKVKFIDAEGDLIDRGFYEAFTFLITAAAILFAVLFISFLFSEPFQSQSARIGFRIIRASVFTLDILLVFCNLSALFSIDNVWDDFEHFLFFFIAMPSTFTFSIGLFLILYGLIMKYKRTAVRHG